MKTASRSHPPRVNKHAPPTAADWNESIQAFEFRYRLLFEQAPYGILLLDAESGEISDANPFAVDLLDYPFEELCGRELWEISRFEDIAVSRAFFKKLRGTRQAHSDGLPLRKKDGQVIAVEIDCQVYQEGEHEVAQCTIRLATVPASRAQQAALLAHSQRLRAPLTEIAWMIGLMELEQRLVPQPRSRFDQAALRHVRRNLQTLVHTFNDLSAVTGESLLWVADSLSPGGRTAPPPPPRAHDFERSRSARVSLADQPCHS